MPAEKPEIIRLPSWTKVASPAAQARIVTPVSPGFVSAFSSDQVEGGLRQYDEFLLDSEGNEHYFSQKYDHLRGNAAGGLKDEDEYDTFSVGDKDFTMDSLPQGSQKRFISHLVPRVCDFFGTLENPLDTTLNCSVIRKVIQATWDTVFPKITHKVEVYDDAVYYMVSSRTIDISMTKPVLLLLQAMQHVSEWKNHFRNAAAQALQAFWTTNRDYDTKEGRATYIKDALGPKLPFMFRDVMRSDDGEIIVRATFLLFISPSLYICAQELGGAFKSKLVLATFASHLDDTASVPAGHTLDSPRGALLVSVVAVCYFSDFLTYLVDVDV